MKALILAAGFGTRLLPHTRLLPKPLMPIAGQPLLDILIRQLIAAGCEAVMINTHYLSDQIQAFVARHQYAVPVYIRHEPEILGTGGAIRNLADFWDERPFIVVNGDVLTTIDFKELYRFHLSHSHPATLALCDYPEFNRVTVTPAGFIADFNGAAFNPAAAAALLTFTGIQILSPSVLEFLPSGRCSSTIEAFSAMIAAGHQLKAWIADQDQWMDIGAPERYSRTVAEIMARQSFAQESAASPAAEIQYQQLQGDGSDRIWTRIRCGSKSLVMVNHGIRQTAGVAEVDSFLSIGHLLFSKGVPVPEIINRDAFSGLVMLQDLGDQHLQTLVKSLSSDDQLESVYRRIIDQLLFMGVNCKDDFDSAAAYQSPRYDRELILEKECRYFVEAFLHPCTDVNISFAALAPEFFALAEKIEKYAIAGFMHRDFQSRNIMAFQGDYYFIDFQGGRIGPIQYDLASLLIDPYTALAPDLRERLINYGCAQAKTHYGFEPDHFRNGYDYCAISRNLQILGAFGFLSRTKHKPQFEAYMPPARNSLIRLLSQKAAEFPRLFQTVTKAVIRRPPAPV